MVEWSGRAGGKVSSMRYAINDITRRTPLRSSDGRDGVALAPCG